MRDASIAFLPPTARPVPPRHEVWPALPDTAVLAGYFGIANMIRGYFRIENVIRAALAARPSRCDAMGRAARGSPDEARIGAGIVVPEGNRRCVVKGLRVFSCLVVC